MGSLHIFWISQLRCCGRKSRVRDVAEGGSLTLKREVKRRETRHCLTGWAAPREFGLLRVEGRQQGRREVNK